MSALPSSARTGFSLVELVVILAIIGVLVGTAMPNLLRWQENERVKSSARAVSDALLLARGEAIRTGDRMLVVLDSALGAPARIVVVDDGPEATSNCSIGAGEVIHSVDLDAGISFGTSSATARVSPDDEGAKPAEYSNGSTFTDAGGVNSATWLLFQSDGLPRTFTPGGPPCSVGLPAAGGGGFYLTNGDRDYAVVMRPLGTSRVHRWQDSGWSQ